MSTEPEKSLEDITPPGRRRISHHEKEVFSDDIQDLIEKIRDEYDQINARIDGNSGRIDQISASLRELALRPPPDLGKGISSLMAVSISLSLASLATSLTTVGLLLSHVVGVH